ncbi:MAG: hypothetical protein NTU41_11735 [Chloroflexi bacterium]|nr:hypothetical protein [Chloroflexota bacterium]
MGKTAKVVIMVLIVCIALGLGSYGTYNAMALGSELKSVRGQLSEQASREQADYQSLTNTASSRDSSITSLTDSTTAPPSYSRTANVKDIGTSSGSFAISLQPMDVVYFQFSVAGANVYFKVYDAYDNLILTGNKGNSASQGGGAFISTGGGYKISFESTGILTHSVVTLDYTVYPPAPSVKGNLPLFASLGGDVIPVP